MALGVSRELSVVSVAKVGGMALKFLLRTGSVSAVVQLVASWWWVLLWWCVSSWWVPMVVLAVLLSPLGWFFLSSVLFRYVFRFAAAAHFGVERVFKNLGGAEGGEKK